MLIDPPIDKLVEKVGCRYALVCIVSKRARVLQQKLGEDGSKALDESTISVAARDFYKVLCDDRPAIPAETEEA